MAYFFNYYSINMQRKKAIRLMKAWINRHCNHPQIENEYIAMKETGNKVCTVCGQTIYTTIFSKPVVR